MTTTNFEDDIVISFEDFDMPNQQWNTGRFGLDPDFNSRFGVHGSGSNSISDTSVNEPTIAFPVPTVSQPQQARDIDTLSLDIMLSQSLEISPGASGLSPSSPFHDSSGYNSAEETFSLPASSVSYPQSAPSSITTGTELGYSSGEESSRSVGPGPYPQVASGTFPFTSQSHSLEDRRPSLAIRCDRVPEPFYGPVAPYTPPLSSGYTSDSGSLHSLEYLSPQHTHGRRDSLSVPVTVMESRGRPRLRMLHSSGNRHLPYVHTGRCSRSGSFTGLAPPDLEAMMSPQSGCFQRRPRSSSVISTSSSFNGDVSDSDGYFSSHELSDGYSRYSHSRDPSPAYDSSSEAGPLTTLHRRHDRNDDVIISGNEYRENVGSPAIVKASTDRRKKPARFKCNQANCESTFTTKQNLRNHLNSHLGIKKFACGTCGKTFTTLHVRERHQNTCRAKRKPEFVPPSAEFSSLKQESSTSVNLWDS
ncbi:hypothetical protein L218DRAFT_622873 [Marasmius fiardii PR-910]|nr:hypothetical protein L218DRAFT_622873 [Marasmius fiardii PR-910]